MVESIQFKGLNELNALEQETAQLLTTEYYEKIKRLLHNETSLMINIKQHKKGGSKSTKYSFTVKAIAPTTIFEAEKFDWDLARTIHMTFDALINEINHSFHKQSGMHK